MRTIKREGSIEFIQGGKGFYAGRVYQAGPRDWRALPRGLNPLETSFKTENEAIDALKDFFRQGSPVRRRVQNAPLSVARAGARTPNTIKPAQPARTNDARRQSIRKRSHHNRPAGWGKI